jgi:hypothetical protein
MDHDGSVGWYFALGVTLPVDAGSRLEFKGLNLPRPRVSTGVNA